MKDFFKGENIEFYGAIRLSDCKITKQYLLDRAGFKENATVIMMLLPYRSELLPKNLSVYASVADYHRYVQLLSERVKKYIKNLHPSALFEVFADHSPINEVHGACISGLGFIGDNGLLINEKYSSFVFLCEFITDLSADELGLELVQDVKIKRCLGCKACMRACPSNCMDEGDPRPKTECLSAITQKKGELSPSEIELIKKHGSVWGCDICQNVCPYTKNASFTPIEFFRQGVITELTAELVEKMSEQELLCRPFAWRGRQVILRNLYLTQTK